MVRRAGYAQTDGDKRENRGSLFPERNIDLIIPFRPQTDLGGRVTKTGARIAAEEVEETEMKTQIRRWMAPWHNFLCQADSLVYTGSR